MPAVDPIPPTRSAPLWLLVPAILVVLCVAALAIASIGNPFPLVVTGLTLLEVAFRGAGPAAAYLLAAVGLGRLVAPLYRPLPGPGESSRVAAGHDPLALQVALGLGLMLTLAHLLGVLGLLAGDAGRLLGAVVIAFGLVLLGHQVVTARRMGRFPEWNGHFSAAWICAGAAAPALVLLFIAACNPPGWLWESEGRGYDALSYHLQLPQEWLVAGRIQPLEHNVYSFLPSYVESAFYHMGAVLGGSGGATPLMSVRKPDVPVAQGLLAGDGYDLLSTQFLHAGIAVIAAVLIGRLVMACVRRGCDDSSQRAASVAGVLAAALVLSTPWVIVTGSLAYNDLGVVALLAAALIAAMDGALTPMRRGVVVGILIAVACGIKPTALLFAGLPAGLALLAFSRPRHWPVLVVAGSIAGVAMLAPWLIRNAIYAGNPVFPFAASVFGHAHWTAEQIGRYAAAHSFAGGLFERIRLLFVVDQADPAGPRHRGMLHPQWSIFFPLVLISAAIALASPRARILAAFFAAMLMLQVLVWLVATHLQSRFLLPLLVPGAALFGVAVGELLPRARFIAPAAAAIVLLAAATALVLFAREPRIAGTGPNEMLVPGPAARSGELFRWELHRARPAERQEFFASRASPEHFVNLALPGDAKVYLLGHATPLYYTRPLIYATTWDRSLFTQAIAASPREADWAAQLRRAGVTHVLVNFAELQRLERSGFLDPLLGQEIIVEFLNEHADPVHVWPREGVAIYELRADPPGGSVNRDQRCGLHRNEAI
jgi:hypothetical protein